MVGWIGNMMMNYPISAPSGTTYVNLLTNANMEVDTGGDGLADDWAVSGAPTTTLDADAKYGTYSQKVIHPASGYIWRRIDSLLTADHKYYICAWGKVISGTGKFKIATFEAGMDILSKTFTGSWSLGSIILAYASGQVYLNTNYPNGTALYDGFMLVDLTAPVGAGNEMDLATCDATLPFFTGSKNF